MLRVLSHKVVTVYCCFGFSTYDPVFLSSHFHLVSTPASSRYTTSGAPLTDPRVMQLTRSDPRQKQGTPPATPLTQVHPQPAPLHFMQQQPQQPQLAGRFPMPPTGVLPPEPNQLPFFGTRDSQPPPLMSPVAMVRTYVPTVCNEFGSLWSFHNTIRIGIKHIIPA